MTSATTAEPTDRTESGKPTAGSVSTLRRYRTPAAIVIAVAAAFVVWLVARDGGSAKSDPEAVSPAQLRDLAASVGHPIFWAGSRPGTTYELVKADNSSILVRYLPAGVAVGDKGQYLTVATYPFPGAYAAIQSVSKEKGSTTIPLGNGGAAETSAPVSASTNVHVAYLGVDYQAEIYDPTQGRAAALVKDGELAALGKLDVTPLPKFKATSASKLRAAAASVGHPIYWIGAQKGYTYQLAEMPKGQVQVRYVPKGQAGAASSYLTIGTYPIPKAFAAV